MMTLSALAKADKIWFGREDFRPALARVTSGSFSVGARYYLPEVEFEKYADEWCFATEETSNLDEIYEHPNFIKMVRLGVDIAHLVEERMRNQSPHWFHVWEAIRYVRETGDEIKPPRSDYRSVFEEEG